MQGSDAHKAQQLASLVRTTFGELPLAPTYGAGDMAFTEIDIAGIAVQINSFHPDIKIEDIILYRTRTGRNAFEILFTSETPLEEE